MVYNEPKWVVWCCTARSTGLLKLGEEAEAGDPFGDSRERVENESDQEMWER